MEKRNTGGARLVRWGATPSISIGYNAYRCCCCCCCCCCSTSSSMDLRWHFIHMHMETARRGEICATRYSNSIRKSTRSPPTHIKLPLCPLILIQLRDREFARRAACCTDIFNEQQGDSLQKGPTHTRTLFRRSAGNDTSKGVFLVRCSKLVETSLAIQ